MIFNDFLCSIMFQSSTLINGEPRRALKRMSRCLPDQGMLQLSVIIIASQAHPLSDSFQSLRCPVCLQVYFDSSLWLVYLFKYIFDILARLYGRRARLQSLRTEAIASMPHVCIIQRNHLHPEQRRCFPVLALNCQVLALFGMITCHVSSWVIIVQSASRFRSL